MSSIVKPLIVSLIVIIAVSLIFTQLAQTTNNWANDELDFALRTATQDATAVMMQDDYLFGTDMEESDLDVDIQKASEQFKKSFFANIGSTISENNINNMSVSLSGYAGYRYIYGVYGNNSPTMPYAYSHHGDAQGSNKLYEFTLGETIYVTNLDNFSEEKINISDLPEYYFSGNITNENFRTITIMSSINDFLTTFYSSDQNITAMNAGSGIKFELGLVDYAVDDPDVISKMSAVIDGPSFFAVVDCYDPQLESIVRLISIGASELVLK